MNEKIIFTIKLKILNKPLRFIRPSEISEFLNNSRIFPVTCHLLLITFCLVFVLTAGVFAQERPFKIGETLTYEAKLSKIIQGISVAELNFIVNKAPNGKDLLIKSEAVSKGTLAKLIGFSFIQQIQSTVSGSGEFRILESVKHDVQKKRIRDSVSTFDYQNKTSTFIEKDPNNPTGQPRKIDSAIFSPMNDAISGIYAVRLLPLAAGQSFEVAVSDTGAVYKIPVRVTAREQQKTALGKIWCYRVEPEVFGPNRFIDKKGSFVLWLTEDARHLPVRIQINTEVAGLDVKVEVKLKTAIEGK